MQIILTALIQSFFVINVRVVDAVEDGPLVVEVTVAYSGQQRLRVWHLATYEDYDLYDIELPRTWNVMRRTPNRQYFHFGIRPEITEITPGWKESYRIPVHQWFIGNIPVGSAIGRVKYRLLGSFDGSDTKFPITISKSVAFEVAPFSPAVVAEIERDIARICSANRQSRDSEFEIALRNQADRILGTSHTEFVPVGLNILTETGSQPTRYVLRNFLWKYPNGAEKLHERDVATILKFHNNIILTDIFHDWLLRERTLLETLDDTRYFLARGLLSTPQHTADGRIVVPDEIEHVAVILSRRGQRLPRQHLQRLKQAKSLWLRAFVYVTFSDRIEREWSDQFLADLQDRVRPISGKQYQEWLGQLGAERYEERELATTQLLLHLDRARPYLIDADRKPISPEASFRVKQILKEGSNAGRDPVESAFLEWIRGWPVPNTAGVQVLKILSGGDPDAPSTRDARAILYPSR